MPDTPLVITIEVLGADEAVADVAKVSYSIESLGLKMDKLTAAMTKPVLAVTDLDKAHKQLSQSLTDANQKLLTISNSLEHSFVTAAKLGTEAIIGLNVVLDALGAKSANALQGGALAIQAYSGGTYGQSFKTAQALQQLTNPLNLSTITGGYQGLLADAFSGSQAMQLTKNVTDIASLTTDKSGTFSALMSGIDEFKQSGFLNGMVVRQLQKAGLPIAQSILAANPGMTQQSLSLAEQQGNPLLDAQFMQQLMSMSGPWAGFVGGRAKYAGGTLGGAFGELDKQITVGISNALVNSKGTGPLDKLTSWLAGFSQTGLDGQTRGSYDMSKFSGYFASLGKELPNVARGAEQLLKAAEPLGATLMQVGKAILPMVGTFEKDVSNLLNSPLVHILEYIVGEASKLSVVRTTVVDIFDALVAYAALSKIVGIIGSVGKAIGSLDTMWNSVGQHSAGAMLQASADTFVTASDTILAASENMARAAGVDVAGEGGGAAAGGAAGGAMAFGPAVGLALIGGLIAQQGADALIPKKKHNEMLAIGPVLTGINALYDKLTEGSGSLNLEGLPSGDKAKLHGGKLTFPKGDQLPYNGQMVTISAPITITATNLGKNPSAVGGIIAKELQDAMERYFASAAQRGATGGGGGK